MTDLGDDKYLFVTYFCRYQMSLRGSSSTAIPISKLGSVVKSGKRPGAGEFERLLQEDRARNVISKPR